MPPRRMTKPITQEEFDILKTNPNITSSGPDRIYYSARFKCYFVRERKKGRTPESIFLSAGLYPEILGPERISRAAERWVKNPLYQDAEDDDPFSDVVMYKTAAESSNPLKSAKEKDGFKKKSKDKPGKKSKKGHGNKDGKKKKHRKDKKHKKESKNRTGKKQ